MNDKIQAILNELTASGLEKELQVTVYHRGKMIADCASGENTGNRTLFPVFSTTKGVAATLVHIIYKEYKLDYDTPISVWWPEFGIKGKEKISMRHVLTHSAGVPQLPHVDKESDFADWALMCAKVADLPLLWEPGTESHYHAITYSWLTMEPLRRMTGLSFNQLVKKYLTPVIGNHDCYCGMTEHEALTLPIATLLPGPPPDPNAAPPATAPDPYMALAIPKEVTPLEYWMNKPIIRQACLPASTGIMTTGFLAGMYNALLTDVWFTPGELEYLTTHIHQPNIPEDKRTMFTLGYASRDPGVFGHGGYGGSNAFADKNRQLAVAVNKSRVNAADVGGRVMEALKDL